MSQWGGKGREKKSIAPSGGGKKKDRVRRGEAGALGWLLSPSSCHSWTTLRMGIDKEKTVLVEGSHQSTMDDGVQVPVQGHPGGLLLWKCLLNAGGLGFMNLSVHFFWCHREVVHLSHTSPCGPGIPVCKIKASDHLIPKALFRVESLYLNDSWCKWWKTINPGWGDVSTGTSTWMEWQWHAARLLEALKWAWGDPSLCWNQDLLNLKSWINGPKPKR